MLVSVTLVYAALILSVPNNFFSFRDMFANDTSRLRLVFAASIFTKFFCNIFSSTAMSASGTAALRLVFAAFFFL